MNTTEVMHCTMTLAQFLETIEKKIGTFEGRDAAELSDCEQKIEEHQEELRKIANQIEAIIETNITEKEHFQAVAKLVLANNTKMDEVVYTQTEQDKTMLSVVDTLEKMREILKESNEQLTIRLQRILEMIIILNREVHNSKSGDENPSRASEEELAEEMRRDLTETLSKEIEHQVIEALDEDLETKVTDRFIQIEKRFIEIRNSFAEKQTTMQASIEEKILNLDVDFNEKLSTTAGKTEQMAQELESLSEKISKLKQEPTTSDEDVKKILESKIIVEEMIRSALQKMKPNSEEFEQKMKAEIDKLKLTLTDADTKLKEYAKSEIEKITASINTKLEVLETSLEQTKLETIQKREAAEMKNKTQYVELQAEIGVLKGTKEKDKIEIQQAVLSEVPKKIQKYIKDHPTEVTKSINDEIKAMKPKLREMDKQIETFKQQVAAVGAQEKYVELEKKVKEQDKEIENIKDKYYAQTQLLEKVLKQLKDKRMVSP